MTFVSDLRIQNTLSFFDKAYFYCTASKEEKRQFFELTEKFNALSKEVTELRSQVPHAAVFSVITCGAPRPNFYIKMPIGMQEDEGRYERPASFSITRLFSRRIAPLIAFATRGAYCSKNLRLFVQKSNELKHLKKSIESIGATYKNHAAQFKQARKNNFKLALTTCGLGAIAVYAVQRQLGLKFNVNYL